jgi:hypothetical protein
MWTPQNRKRYDRSQLRYPTDVTDDEWALIAPLIPPAKPGGNIGAAPFPNPLADIGSNSKRQLEDRVNR